jgi:hypothetical protein
MGDIKFRDQQGRKYVIRSRSNEVAARERSTSLLENFNFLFLQLEKTEVLGQIKVNDSRYDRLRKKRKDNVVPISAALQDVHMWNLINTFSVSFSFLFYSVTYRGFENIISETPNVFFGQALFKNSVLVSEKEHCFSFTKENC